MNILYISYDGVTDPLGQSQVLPYLKGLVLKGHRFSLLSFEKKSRINDVYLMNRTMQIMRSTGIRWLPLIYHKSPSILATSYDIVVGIIAAWYLIISNRITLIHARSYVAALIAMCLKIGGYRFIFDTRGFWSEEKVEAGHWKRDSLLYRIAKILEQWFSRNSDWIVVLSFKAKELMQRDYLGSCQRNIDVIPTCADLNLFFPQERDFNKLPNEIPESAFVFIYFGSVGTWYCIDEIIEFFKVAKRKIDKAYFVFLISHPTNYPERLMSSKGFSRGEFTVKSVYHDEVSIWLNASDVSVFFIRPVSSKAASCPTKLGESLACGIPVIINSGIGDTERIVIDKKVGAVIEEFSDMEYERALEELKELLTDKINLKNRCRSIAEEYFSLQKAVDKYHNIYHSLGK